MRVKTCLPPQDGRGWTVLLDCGHTVYDVKSKRRPWQLVCPICKGDHR